MPLPDGDPGRVHAYQVRTETLTEARTAVVRGSVDVADLGPWVAQSLALVAAHLAAEGTAPSGPPFGRYHRLARGRFEAEVGFPVTDRVPGGDGFVASNLPSCSAALTWHVGPYEGVAAAYEALGRWIADHDGVPVGDAWEVYETDPARERDPAKLRTRVIQPYRPSSPAPEGAADPV